MFSELPQNPEWDGIKPEKYLRGVPIPQNFSIMASSLAKEYNSKKTDTQHVEMKLINQYAIDTRRVGKNPRIDMPIGIKRNGQPERPSANFNSVNLNQANLEAVREQRLAYADALSATKQQNLDAGVLLARQQAEALSLGAGMEFNRLIADSRARISNLSKQDRMREYEQQMAQQGLTARVGIFRTYNQQRQTDKIIHHHLEVGNNPYDPNMPLAGDEITQYAAMTEAQRRAINPPLARLDIPNTREPVAILRGGDSSDSGDAGDAGLSFLAEPEPAAAEPVAMSQPARPPGAIQRARQGVGDAASRIQQRVRQFGAGGGGVRGGMAEMRRQERIVEQERIDRERAAAEEADEHGGGDL
jgi:hypothetical protein